ncbi:MAG: helix-turn-helix domain-containing protein [Anaerolineae bacterium]
MNVQIIEKAGKPEWAVIPYEIYQQLLGDAEMLRDVRDFDAVRQAVDSGEELVPDEVAYAILDGRHPIKVWREYRQLTQQELAKQAGISAAYLSQIESGKRKGTTSALATVAAALNLTLDDILEME